MVNRSCDFDFYSEGLYIIQLIVNLQSRSSEQKNVKLKGLK